MSGKATTRYPLTKVVIVNGSVLFFSALTLFIAKQGFAGTAAADTTAPVAAGGGASSLATPAARSTGQAAHPAPTRPAARAPVTRTRGS